MKMSNNNLFKKTFFSVCSKPSHALNKKCKKCNFLARKLRFYRERLFLNAYKSHFSNFLNSVFCQKKYKQTKGVHRNDNYNIANT